MGHNFMGRFHGMRGPRRGGGWEDFHDGRSPWGRHSHRHGGGRRRLFDQGELKFVVLALIAEQPRHGYEIIKEIEARVGGAYAPSAGVIYPLLTMLEEMGLVELSGSEGAKKLYAITKEGEVELAQKVDRLMDNSDADIARLEALIENILLAAKLESDSHNNIKEEINATELAEMIVHRFAKNSKQIPIRADIEESLYFETDVVGFISMLSNLFENAINYSEPGSAIYFQLKSEENGVFIKLSDQGNGIPEQERKLVFEKFYRIGDENTRKSKGTGLRLFIVKKFVDRQKGTITIEDNKPQGVIFSMLICLDEA